MTTASALIDALATNLGAASTLGSANVSTDYNVMETSSACCAVIGWSDVTSVPITFGGEFATGWTCLIEGFVKDNNDPKLMMKNINKFFQTMKDSIESDTSMQGEIEAITEIRINRRPGEAYTVSGHTWLPITIEVDFLEL